MEEVKKKNKKQTFMAGVITILIAQVVIKFLGLIYRIVITNIPNFGDEGNGLYGAGFQIYMLLLTLASTGVPNAIAKLVSERVVAGKHKEAHHIFKVAFSLFAVIGLIGSAVLFLGANFIATKMIGNPDVEGVLVALSPSIFFVAISAVIRGYFNGMYNMKATSNSQTLEQLFKCILTIVIVVLINIIFSMPTSFMAQLLNLTEDNVTSLMAAGANLASTIATAIGFVYLYFFYRNRKKEIWKNINESKEEYIPKRKKEIIKMILFISIPMSLASIVSAINRNVDSLTVINGLTTLFTRQGILSKEMIVSEATRLYGILSGKVDMLIGLPLSLNIAFATALVPAVSEAMAINDKNTAIRRISFSLRTTVLIGFPCAIGLCVLAEPVLNLLFPNAMAPEAPMLLQISAFTIIFTVFNQTMNGALQGLGKIFIPAISLAVGATAKLILNLILIPIIGVNGAAIGSVVCHIIATIISFVILIKTIKLDISFKSLVLKPVICTTIMAIVAVVSHKLILSLNIGYTITTLIAITLAVITYLISLLVFKVFSKEDYHMLPYGTKIYKALEKFKLV